MSTDGNVYGALMAQVKTITGYSLLTSRKGGPVPSDDHIRVAVLPNDNLPADLSSQAQIRRGVLILTLVQNVGAFDIVSVEAAGTLAETYFPRGKKLIFNGATVVITGYTIRQGRVDNGRWETPIWIQYWSLA